MKIVLSALLVFAVTLSLLTISVYAQESQGEIPSWVKGVANFWVEGNINDGEFGEAITFLIEQRIIQIDSISQPIEDPLTDEEKRLFELEIDQRDDRISILEKEVKSVGLDNSHMLNTIVEKEQEVEWFQDSLTQVRSDFEQWKKDHPTKIGNIGGKSINAETIIELERQLEGKNRVIEELEQDNRELEEENRELKNTN